MLSIEHSLDRRQVKPEDIGIKAADRLAISLSPDEKFHFTSDDTGLKQAWVCALVHNARLTEQSQQL